MTKVLVIGHDPRLQQSDTLARYAFFADYFFKSIPTPKSELAKYRLAEAVFGYINYLTGNRYSTDQIVLTNLCNHQLPHAPKGRTVYIPESEAWAGISDIQAILSQSSVEIIFAMSQQVNYWLQKLGFYPAVAEFLSDAEPKTKGVTYIQFYYEPMRGRAFTHICCHQYRINDQCKLTPILHVKNWPLSGSFAKAYGKAYEKYVSTLEPQ